MIDLSVIEQGRYRIQDMANLSASRTGVARTIFVSSYVPRHVPRIKLAVNGGLIERETVSISISDEPQVIAGDASRLPARVLHAVFRWVIINKAALLQLWNGDIDTVDFCERMQRVE